MSMSFAKSLKWSAIGVISRYILQTSSILILARLLTPIEFGQVASVMIVISIAVVISQLGMTQLIGSSNENEINSRFLYGLFISISISVFVVVILYFLSENIANFLDVKDSKIIKVLLISIILRAIYSPFEGLLIRLNKYNWIAKVDFFSYLFGFFVISVVFSYLGGGSYSLVFANVCQALISLILILRIFKKLKLNFEVDLCSKELIYTFKRALLISYGQLLSSVISQIDNLIVNKYLGVASLGIYTRSYQLMVVPCNFIGQIINKVLIGRFSYNVDNHELILKKGLLLVLFSSTLVSAIISIFGDDLTLFLLGDGWESVTLPLIILSFSIYPRMIYKICEPILIARKYETKIVYGLKLYLLILLLICYWLRNYNLVGISFAVLISTHIYGLWCQFYIVKLFPKIKRYTVFCLIVNIIVSLAIWDAYQ